MGTLIPTSPLKQPRVCLLRGKPHISSRLQKVKLVFPGPDWALASATLCVGPPGSRAVFLVLPVSCVSGAGLKERLFNAAICASHGEKNFRSTWLFRQVGYLVETRLRCVCHGFTLPAIQSPMGRLLAKACTGAPVCSQLRDGPGCRSGKAQ